MQQLEFSIIVPTFNRPGPLKACLQALKQLQSPPGQSAQTWFEVIIVDDGSALPVDAVVAPYQSCLTLSLVCQANAGPAAARNTGAARAKGRYLAFTDDDCRPAPNWLLVLAQQFQHTPTGAVSGRKMNALTDNMYAATSQAITDVVYAYFNADQNQAQFISTSNLALATESFRAIGGFNEAFSCLGAEDRELGDRWQQQGHPIIFAPEAVVQHAHDLGLRSLWRQHFNFGRGAFRFHQARQQRGASGLKPDLRFYLQLLQYPFGRLPPHTAVWLSTLIVLAELANATGYFCDALARGVRRPRAESVRR